MPGAQRRLSEAGVQADNPDFVVIHLDTFEQLPDVTFPKSRIVATEVAACGFGKAGDIVLRQQAPRYLPRAFEGGYMADQVLAFVFELCQRTAEHRGVVHGAVGKRAIETFKPQFNGLELLTGLFRFGRAIGSLFLQASDQSSEEGFETVRRKNSFFKVVENKLIQHRHRNAATLT